MNVRRCRGASEDPRRNRQNLICFLPAYDILLRSLRRDEKLRRGRQITFRAEQSNICCGETAAAFSGAISCDAQVVRNGRSRETLRARDLAAAAFAGGVFRERGGCRDSESQPKERTRRRFDPS